MEIVFEQVLVGLYLS